ncbi:hypothetical protein [Rheinheimera mangrovi]|uniref:hypothetical protein n=1 Tax=Rheinheimera mangrovi TaxID=2498451 RepID=UPI000F8D67B1|nr:hypothetical protein [Rheinheimera mangrovi]
MLSATQVGELLGNYGIPGLFLLVLFYVLINFENMFKSWTVFRTSRIAVIKQALEASAENPALQQCYKTELETEHFRLVSGIVATPEYRKSVLEVLSKSEGKLTLNMIRRSQEFKDLDSSGVSIQLATRYYVWKLIALLFGIVNFLMAFLSLSYLIYWAILEVADADYHLFGIYFLLFSFGAYFFIREVWSYNNAMKVKHVLDCLDSEHGKAS